MVRIPMEVTVIRRVGLLLAVAAGACSSGSPDVPDSTVRTDSAVDGATDVGTDTAADVDVPVPDAGPVAPPGSTEALLQEVCAGRPRTGPAFAFAYSTAPTGITGALRNMAHGDLEAVHLVVERPVRVERLWLMFRGMTGGHVRVRITEDYGRSNPDTDHDLITPFEVDFTSMDPVELTLPTPLDLDPARHAWVVVEHVTEPMGLAVAPSRGGSFRSYVHSAWEIQQLMAMGGDAATFRWVQVSAMDGSAREYAVEARGEAICDRQGPTWFSDASHATQLTGTTNQTSVRDVDGDGWEDLVGTRTVTTGMTSADSLEVWRNRHDGTFEDISARTGLDHAVGRMSLWGDFDSNGRADVYAGVYRDGAGPFTPASQSRVWMQGTDGHFTLLDVPMEAAGPTASGSVGDCDGDGTQDLYVGQWLRQYPANPAPSYLFRGQGAGMFTDISAVAGLPTHFGFSPAYGVTYADWNNDGIQDIFVANYGGQPNNAWRNDGHCSLTDVAGDIGSDSDGMGSAGTSFGYAFADYDNDGDLDAYETNIAHPRYDEAGIFTDHSRLLRNAGPPDYHLDNVVDEAGILFTEGEIASAWGDYDNDGDLDLYVAITYPFEFSRFYRQGPAGHFSDETYLSGTSTEMSGRAVWFDYDRDGSLDLITAPGGAWTVFHNDTHTASHWLELRLDQPTGNTQCLGARITVRDSAGVTRIREIDGGSSTWGSQSPLTQHVGLGTAGGPVRVSVRWPDGMSTVYDGVGTDHLWRITRGAQPALVP